MCVFSPSYCFMEFSIPLPLFTDSHSSDIMCCSLRCSSMQQLLPQKLLEENRARNIPALTPNQLAVIYKLIWYQDGYEQPSEEDLKRIMIVSKRCLFCVTTCSCYFLLALELLFFFFVSKYFLSFHVRYHKTTAKFSR